MIRLTCAVLLAVLALQCAPALAGTPVRIAVTSGGHGTTSLKPLDRSVKALEARFGPSNVTIRERVTLTELGHMLERGEVDYFISTSGVSRRNLSEGSRDLLTITDSRFPDPNKSYGSLFFTRRGSGIKTLEDMRDRTLVANHPNGPYSYLVGMGEIERAGYDASTFFKSQRFLMQSAEDVVQAVLDGRADVGIVASCILEDFFPRSPKPAAISSPCPSRRPPPACARRTNIPTGRFQPCAARIPRRRAKSCSRSSACPHHPTACAGASPPTSRAPTKSSRPSARASTTS